MLPQDEEMLKEKEFQERVEIIKERNFTVGLGLGLLYSNNRGGILGAMLLGDNKEFIIGFSAGFMETPDIRSMDSEYITGSNFLLGYAKDNVFVIATSGAVGTWAKEKCVQEYSWRQATCTDGENGIVSGNTATIGYANIGGFKGFTLSLNYILDTDKDDEDFEGDDLKNTFEFSIGFNI